MATRYVSAAISGDAVATAIAISSILLLIEKSFEYKVFDAGVYLGSWPDVISDLHYIQDINSPGSAVEAVLGRSADNLILEVEDLLTEASEDLQTEDAITLGALAETVSTVGEDTDVDLNYDVEIWAYYGSIETMTTEDEEALQTEAGEDLLAVAGAPNGAKLFTGYISRYRAIYGEKERVTVTILGYGSELAHRVIKSGANTTRAFSSQDPTAIAKAILDDFTADGGIVDYDSQSADSTGSVVSYTFRLNTVEEGLRKMIELCPSDWYWYVDQGENIYHLHRAPATPAHTFVFGKHIKSVEVDRTLEALINEVYFIGGETGGVPLFKYYSDATSRSTWRPGVIRLTDQRVTTAASAQILSEDGQIDRRKDPVYTSVIEISDQVYEIESIRVGDLVGFQNFGNFIDDLQLQVVSVMYSPRVVRIQLDALLPRVSKRLEDIKRNLLQKEQENLPSAPS